MILEFNNGRKAMVYKDTMWGDYVVYDTKTGHDDLNMLDDELKYCRSNNNPDYKHSKDVAKVLVYPNRCNASHLLKPNSFDRLFTESTEVLWEREPQCTEMTIKELEDQFGIKNLKIVKDK